MKKILIGFDGSDESRDALALGDEFAKLEGAKLIVAVVFPFDPLPVQESTFAKAESTYFRERFNEVKEQLGHGFEIRLNSWVSPAKALSDLAEGEGIDLIVIGSTHRGTLGRVLPGSVGERLLHGAPCAVAVAPRGYARREHPDLQVIGVGFDGSAESSAALAEAKSLAQQLGARVRVIGAYWASYPNPPFGTLGYLEIIRRDMEGHLRKAEEVLGDTVDHELVLSEGPAAAVLADQGVELDLLLIGSRGYGPLRRTLLGGVSTEVMRTAPCPVLVVPRGAKSTREEPLRSSGVSDVVAGGVS